MPDKEFFVHSKERAIAMYKACYIYGPVAADLELEVQEMECIFTKITRLFGIALWKTTKKFQTLLEAEENFDTECAIYTEKGYFDGPAD